MTMATNGIPTMAELKAAKLLAKAAMVQRLQRKFAAPAGLERRPGETYAGRGL